jgi:hypothetical protein
MPDDPMPPATGDPTPHPKPAADPAKPDPAPAPAPPDLGDAGKKALDAERAAKRAAEKRAADAEARLQAIEDRDKSEAQKTADRAARAEQAEAAATAKLTRLEVAIDKNVPADLVEFLVGDTREAVEAKADALLKHIAPAGATPPGQPATGDPAPTPTPTSGPDLHGGTRQPAKPDEDAEFNAYMSANFPQYEPQKT